VTVLVFDSLLLAKTPSVRVAFLVGAVVLLAGCNGGTVDRHALTNDAATIDSINCEAVLLADGIARNRVTTFFAREQAEELQQESANLANALAHRPTAPGLEQRVRAKAKEAARLAGRLAQLHDHPTGRPAARALAAAFKRAGHCP
jgi:hypothetical protein